MTQDHTMTTTLRIVPAPKPLVCRLRDDGSELSNAAADQIEALQAALIATAEAAADHLRSAADRGFQVTTLQAENDRLRALVAGLEASGAIQCR